MQAARRLYLYAMSGITLAVVATGLVLLLRVVLDGFFPDPQRRSLALVGPAGVDLDAALAAARAALPPGIEIVSEEG